MQENKPTHVHKKNRINRRPSLNTSISSTDSLNIVKKKFAMESKPASGNLPQQKQKIHLADNVSSKLKVCDGQKLSYQVMKGNSKQKKAQFLQRYANDPFMRIKFQKSVEKFNRSKSRQLVKSRQHGEKQIKSKIPSKKDINIANKSYTTFRQQIKQESQKTVKLINNCKQLVEELKKNRLIENDQGRGHQDRGIYLSNRFESKKYQGAFTDRV